MNILITNDDGIDSPGLEALEFALRKSHHVFIVAPDRDRSGTSQSITVGRPLAIQKLSERHWITDGTPADCVRLAFGTILTDRIDLVISGINMGANLGTDLLYSGTVGAARQAAMMGKPAIAASVAGYRNIEDTQYCVNFVANSAPLLFEALTEARNILIAQGRGIDDADAIFINVNTPVIGDGRIAITRPGRMSYETKFIEQEEGEVSDTQHFRSCSTLLPVTPEDSEDRKAIEAGSISISGLGLWGASSILEESLRKAMDLTRILVE